MSYHASFSVVLQHGVHAPPQNALSRSWPAIPSLQLNYVTELMHGKHALLFFKLWN